MTTVKMDKITVTEVEREIPDACPKCGRSFADGGLVEEQLIGSSQEIESFTPGDEQSWSYEESEYCSDICYVVGFRCTCGHQLISTEE